MSDDRCEHGRAINVPCPECSGWGFEGDLRRATAKIAAASKSLNGAGGRTKVATVSLTGDEFTAIEEALEVARSVSA